MPVMIPWTAPRVEKSKNIRNFYLLDLDIIKAVHAVMVFMYGSHVGSIPAAVGRGFPRFLVVDMELRENTTGVKIVQFFKKINIFGGGGLGVPLHIF